MTIDVRSPYMSRLQAEFRLKYLLSDRISESADTGYPVVYPVSGFQFLPDIRLSGTSLLHNYVVL